MHSRLLPIRGADFPVCRFIVCWFLLALSAQTVRAEIIVAEGESFTPGDAKGWKITHQNDSYGSHTYGGMWTTHGGCLGAAADSVNSVARKTVSVKEAGKFRVWSKYQAPPYFNYLHQVEVIQNGKTVFSHVFGKNGTDRLWSFSGVSDELWWPWGVDHDCAESPTHTADLTPGAAEIRLTSVANPKPAGDRFIDFLVLTTNPKDEYQGFKPYAVGSPFTLEALAATRLYMRFQNTGAKDAQLSVSRAGHFQPNYGGATTKIPEKSVPAGQWSEWVNIGPFCRLVHDEGLWLSLPTPGTFAVQFARDEAGKDLVGDVKIASGEAVVVPIHVTWNKDAVVKSSQTHAREIIAESKTWRRANGGKKPKEILWYGAFRSGDDWVSEFKAALGYNTILPEKYEQVKRAGYHAHSHNIAEITAFAKTIKDKENFRVLSFGDEISLGAINFKDAKLQEKFRTWLNSKKIGKDDLGVDPAAANLSDLSNPRIAWYAQIFNEEERFAAYREMTAIAKQLIGPQVLTGANYSPHHGCLYYGPIYQWIDIFKQQGMSMFWAEDYIFSVPEPPQMISWMFGQMRCAVKYHDQPIHFYVMPHAPGQEPGFLRRNLLASIGNGTRHIDNFWVAPAENFTENYVGWTYRDTFRVLSESIYDSAEVEKYQAGGKVRAARVAIVLSKATDYNESRLRLPKEQDPFANRCKNAGTTIMPTLCRKEQQLLFLALRHAQHAVDLITEDDIVEGCLKNFDVVHFAGEWADRRIVPLLESWVKNGGVLYACGGVGHLNQFNEADPGMLRLLGLKAATVQKNALHMRTLLELPHCPEIDSITLSDKSKIPCVGLRQQLQVGDAKVLGTWKDGSAAVTVRELGKGKAFAVGTLPGTAYMKSGVKLIPWARGGRHTLYNPADFSADAARLVNLAISEKPIPQAVVCSNALVEGTVLDHKDGTLLTLVNWSNEPVKDVQVSIRLSAAPQTVRSVTQQRAIPVRYADGVAVITVDLAEGDFILLPR